jgi:hypothetical protein
METPHHYVLILADGTTASGPALLERVRRRIVHGESRFTLLVPTAEGEEKARAALRRGLPELQRAALGPVEGVVGPADAVRAAEQELDRRHFDEVIVATAGEPASDWLRDDVPGRIERPDVPVAVVGSEA